MKLGSLMTFTAVLTGFFGLAFLLAPLQLLSYYGTADDPGLELIGRHLGSALAGISVIAWMVRNAASSEARKAVVLGFLVITSAGFVVALLGQLGGLVNALGWSTVAIYLILALGFAYFQFGKPS